MGKYHSVCRTCAEELVTESVTDARQHTRGHREQGHDAEFVDVTADREVRATDAEANVEAGD